MVRVKSRYLLVNILYPEASSALQPKGNVPDIVVYNQPTTDNLAAGALLKAVRVQVASLFGDFGAGTVERNLQVKYLSNATSTFILRITRDHYRLVWAALTIMSSVPTKDGKPCIFRVVRVSGAIRKVEEDAIRRAKMLMLAAKDEMAGQNSRALDSLFGGRVQKQDQDQDQVMLSVDDESGPGDTDAMEGD